MFVHSQNVLNWRQTPLSLNPIKPSNIFEEVLDQLKSAILNGHYKPGSRLPSVRELSKELSVGQAAVREALSALRAMNLVTVRQGIGTIVNEFDPADLVRFMQKSSHLSRNDILHILELRKVLESGTARLAALRRTEQNLSNMVQVLQNMKNDFTNASIGEQADYAFHYEIAKASHNPFLVALMDEVSTKLQSALLASRLHLYQIPGTAKKLLVEHEAIFHSIEARDGSGAEKNMLQHLQNVESSLNIEQH